MLDDFWLRPLASVTQPELTDAMIERTERLLGVRFPRSYLALLRRLNGGVPRRNAHWFSEPDPAHGSHYRFDVLRGVPQRTDCFDARFQTVAGSVDYTDGWEIARALVVVAHGISSYTRAYLDYRSCGPDGEPSVAFISTQHWGTGGRGERLGESYLLPLAADFKTFTQGLFCGTRGHVYGIVSGGLAPDRLATALHATLGKRFWRRRAPGTVWGEDHHLGTHSDDPLQIGWEHRRWKSWLGKKYRARVLLRPNMAADEFLDYPDHAECDWVILCDITSEHRGELEEALERFPYQTIALHIPDLKRLGLK